MDFSESSNLSVEYVKFLALLFDASLYLVHVVELLHGDEHYMILQLTPHGIAEKMKKVAEKQLNNLAVKIEKGTQN